MKELNITFKINDILNRIGDDTTIFEKELLAKYLGIDDVEFCYGISKIIKYPDGSLVLNLNEGKLIMDEIKNVLPIRYLRLDATETYPEKNGKLAPLFEQKAKQNKITIYSILFGE